MCGISGLFRLEPFDEKEREELVGYICRILVELSARGKDATGIALINTKSGKSTIFKKDIEAKEFIKEKRLDELIRHSEFNICLMHTRAATSGKPTDNKNNHPIYSKKSDTILIHNGMLDDVEETIKEHKLQLDGEVDSEIFLRLFEKYKTIQEAINKVSGSLAIALFSQNKLYLYRHYNPLDLLYNKLNKAVYFSSDKDYIINSYKSYTTYEGGLFYEKDESPFITENIDANELITFDFDKEMDWGREEVKPKERKVFCSYERTEGQKTLTSELRPEVKAKLEGKEDFEGEEYDTLNGDFPCDCCPMTGQCHGCGRYGCEMEEFGKWESSIVNGKIDNKWVWFDKMEDYDELRRHY